VPDPKVSVTGDSRARAPISNGAGASRGPYAKSAGRRSEIIRAALASFAAHGYERASLRDIAARAGISHAGLLHHFATKDELLVEALDHYEADERRMVDEAQAAGKTGSALMAELLAWGRKEPDFVRSWSALRVAASDPQHPAHAYFTNRQRRLLAEVATDLANDAAVAPDAAATLLLALFSGLQEQQLTDPAVDVVTPLKIFLDLVLLSRDPA
jgi:AcrR family transcriptional regulator